MEKRKHERIALEALGWRAELIDQLSGEKLGDVVNLSTSGLMIISSGPVACDSLYQVECVSRGPKGQEMRFDVGMRVLWTSPASQADTHWAGAQIIDIAPESGAALTALTRELVES
jgi:hypothetical protein